MNLVPPPQLPSLLPESAPFTQEQRAWLNGFFAGLISVDGNTVTPLSAEESAALMPSAPPQAKGPLDDGDDGEAPWHDQTLPLQDRMKLAEGRPLRRRLMAAMAQQDCGQCGYNCQDYSDAIVLKAEERLNLCVPGGKETARMVKALHAEIEKAPAAPAVVTNTPAVEADAPVQARAPGAGRSRDNPALRHSSRAPGSTSPARRRKPGMSSSISPGRESNTWSAIPSAFFRRMIRPSSRP